MRYDIILAPEAVEDLRRLKAHLRSEVRDAIERHLRNEPAKISRSRIKRLKGLSRPQYRLRVRDIRIFYDVAADAVNVLAILPKPEAELWLKEWAKEERTDD
jgi:mRNA-degrading endonuclease RelE of RelBE toxin-antitoxin system